MVTPGLPKGSWICFVVTTGETHGLESKPPMLSYENLITGPTRPFARPCGTHESVPYSLLIKRNGRPHLAARKAHSNPDCISTAVALGSRRPQSSASPPVRP